MMKELNYSETTGAGESATRMQQTLTGNKWWSVADLCNYLQMKPQTVYTILGRYKHKFNILSRDSNESGYRAKYYRINQHGV